VAGIFERRPNSFEALDRDGHDAVLLYRFELETQTARGERYKGGLPISLASKTAAAILRHWKFLVNHVPGYQGLHAFLTIAIPYRFGAQACQYANPLYTPRCDNPLGVRFLEDIASNNYIMMSLGVDVKPTSGRATLLDYRIPDPRYFARQCELNGVTPLELATVSALVPPYASLDSTDINAVATCPTARHTLQSMEAELCLWHDHWRRFLSAYDSLTGAADRVRAEEVVNDIRYHLSYAYACADEVTGRGGGLGKAGLYARVPAIASHLLREARKSELFDAFIGEFGDGSPTTSIAHAKEFGEVLEASTYFAISLLREVGISGIMADEKIRQRKGLIRILVDRHVTEESTIQRLYGQVGMKRLDNRSHLSDQLQILYSTVCARLQKEGLPAEFDRQKFGEY